MNDMVSVKILLKSGQDIICAMPINDASELIKSWRNISLGKFINGESPAFTVASGQVRWLHDCKWMWCVKVEEISAIHTMIVVAQNQGMQMWQQGSGG